MHRGLVIAATLVALGCVDPPLLPIAHAGQTSIFWSERSGIWSAPVDATVGELLVTAFDVRSIALDASRVYWTDLEPRVPIVPTGVVRGTNLDGTEPRTLASELHSPSGVAIDSTTHTVYWSDLQQNAIYRRSLDGSDMGEQVIGGFPSISAIHSITIDSQARKLYFGFVNPLIDSLFAGFIGRADLDGSQLETVVSGLTKPWGIAVDPANKMVYWTDTSFAGNGVVARAALDGGTAEELVSGLKLPRGIALDVSAGNMYWADAGSGRIHRAQLDGSDAIDLIIDLNQPVAIGLTIVPEPSTAIAACLILAIVLAHLTSPTCADRSRNR